MANDSAIDRSFSVAFNEINHLYGEDKLDLVIEKAQALLREPAIPRYHRMRTLVLLGSSLGDWSEATACCEEAEAVWRVVRRWHPVGEDDKVDTSLGELHGSINELKEALRAEEPEDVEYDVEEAVEERIASYDAEVSAQRTQADIEEDDPEALLAADAAALGTTVEALRALDVRKAYGKPPGVPVIEGPSEESSSRRGVEWTPAQHPDETKLWAGTGSLRGKKQDGVAERDERLQDIMRKPSWRRDH